MKFVEENYQYQLNKFQQKVDKLKASYEKVMKNTSNIRAILSRMDDFTINFHGHPNITVKGIKLRVSGACCSVYVDNSYSTLLLSSKALPFLNKALKSVEEAAKAVAVSNVDLFKKYSMHDEEKQFFQALLKFVLEGG